MKSEANKKKATMPVGSGDLLGCRVCKQKTDHLTDLNICAFGSEGIQVCDTCLVAISEFVRTLRSAAGRGHREGYMSAKQSSNIAA